ncbi:MAG: hypothetical protein KF819_16515 [Labilithrix sp.]|nr:hypothetical protein [Labilithrix sp.]
MRPRSLYVAAATAAAAGVAALVHWGASDVPLVVVLAAWSLAFGALGIIGSLADDVVSSSWRVSAALARGDTTDARAVRASMASSRLTADVRTLLDAHILAATGELERAIDTLDLMLAAPAPRVARNLRESFRSTAFGRRALYHALLGRAEEAARDVATVEARDRYGEHASALALARAVGHARRGDTSALRRALATSRLDDLGYPWRALWCALRHHAGLWAPLGHAYRASDDGDPFTRAIATRLPELAPSVGGPFFDASRADATTITTTSADATAESVEVAPPPPPKPRATGTSRVVGGVWLMSLVIALVFAPHRLATALAVTLAFCGALFVRAFRESLRLRKQLGRVAELQRLAGDDRARQALLEAKPTTPSVDWYTEAAAVEERAGRLDAALAHTDAALALLGGARDAMQRELLVSLRRRAVILAMTGRRDEASATLATMRRRGRSHVLLPSMLVEVELVLAVLEEDWERARRLAATRSVASLLSKRAELLADLVLATTSSEVPKEHVARLEGELAADAESAAWIGSVAPQLRERLATKSAGPYRIAVARGSLAAEPAVAEETPESGEARSPELARRTLGEP